MEAAQSLFVIIDILKRPACSLELAEMFVIPVIKNVLAEILSQPEDEHKMILYKLDLKLPKQPPPRINSQQLPSELSNHSTQLRTGLYWRPCALGD
jgi:hypothetical protein